MAQLDTKQQFSLNAVLYDAVASRNLERVKAALTRGAQPAGAAMDAYFAAREEAPVPLPHFACRYYNEEILDALAAGGLHVDEKDRNGRTALGLAVEDHYLDRVKHLLRLGADPLALFGDRTVLDLARTCNTGPNTSAILDAVLNAVPVASADFNAAGSPASTTVETAEDIQISKPLNLTPHKRDSFKL